VITKLLHCFDILNIFQVKLINIKR